MRETTTEKYLKENGQDLCKFDENIYSCRDQRPKKEIRCIRNMKKIAVRPPLSNFLKPRTQNKIARVKRHTICKGTSRWMAVDLFSKTMQARR